MLYRLCGTLIPKAQPFRILLQSAADEGGAGAGSCLLLGYDGPAAAAVAERSPSLRLPTQWKQLLTEPPSGTALFYITDGLSPDVSEVNPTRVRILQVSSPLQRRWKAFKNGLAAGIVDERLMPLVPLAEMLHMAEHVGGIDAAQVRHRYAMLGGSVRSVLVKAGQTAESIIAAALAHAATLDAVLASATTSGELEGPATLVHLTVREEETAAVALVDSAGNVLPADAVAAPFSQYDAVFASNYVRQRIATKFQSRFVALLGEMVRTADLPSTSVLQGNLYEEFVHRRIQQASNNLCPLRSLDSGAAAAPAIPPVNLSGRPCVEFDDIPELSALQLTPGNYYKPISRSFGAVDFVLAPDIVGNMTLNLRHGISLSALLRVVKAMGFQPTPHGVQPPQLSFYWLLPTRALYDRMRPQPLAFKGRVVSDSADGQASDEGQQQLLLLKQFVQLRQYVVLFAPPVLVSEEAMAEDDEQEVEDGAGYSSSRVTRKRPRAGRHGAKGPAKRGSG